MNHEIKTTVQSIAAELLADALENGDVQATAASLRAGILAGWKAALDSIGAAEHGSDLYTLFNP